MGLKPMEEFQWGVMGQFLTGVTRSLACEITQDSEISVYKQFLNLIGNLVMFKDNLFKNTTGQTERFVSSGYTWP